MKPIIGVQLYTLRDSIKTPEDFDETLKKLKAMNVDCVQISAIGNFSAEIQKRILSKHDINVCVTHKPLEKILNETEKLIEEHKIIGCDSIGLGMPPEEFRGSAKNVRKFISEINRIAPLLKKNGMTFHYHNHAFEFNRLDDMACGMTDLLLEETDPDVFRFIPDVAWIHYAEQNPIELLKRMKGRVKVVHFKDYIINEKRERHFVTLGKGRVNLEEIYNAVCELEIPYIMYEQDDCKFNANPFEATEESMKFLFDLQQK